MTDGLVLSSEYDPQPYAEYEITIAPSDESFVPLPDCSV